MYCECGCGATTPLARSNDRRLGRVYGEPLRFLPGHRQRLAASEHREEERGYETPCWIWQLGISRNGYGKIRSEGRTRGAHVVYFEREYGRVPSGRVLDHLCQQRACVRPSHLQAVTATENARRRPSNVLTLERARWIREQAQDGRRRDEIAAELGVNIANVHRVIQGRTWREAA